eukprot:1245423-Pyramimonas_sp.AAC.3
MLRTSISIPKSVPVHEAKASLHLTACLRVSLRFNALQQYRALSSPTPCPTTTCGTDCPPQA